MTEDEYDEPLQPFPAPSAESTSTRGRSTERDFNFRAQRSRSAAPYIGRKRDGTGIWVSAKPDDFLADLGGDNKAPHTKPEYLMQLQAEKTRDFLIHMNRIKHGTRFSNQLWTRHLIKVYTNFHCPQCHFNRPCREPGHPYKPEEPPLSEWSPSTPDGHYDPRYGYPTAQF